MDIPNLLQDLKKDNKIEHVGSARTGYWKLINQIYLYLVLFAFVKYCLKIHIVTNDNTK